MKIKTTMRCYFIPLRVAYTKSLKISVGWGTDKMVQYYHSTLLMEIEMGELLWKAVPQETKY